MIVWLKRVVWKMLSLISKSHCVFKTYIRKSLLDITQIFIFPMCEKPCLISNEFETDEESSI